MRTMTFISRVSTLVLAIALVACAAPAQNEAKSGTITVEALQKRLAEKEKLPLVVDVREPHEFDAGHIEGAMLAPLGNVTASLDGIAKDREIMLVCRSGRRSAKAQELLAARGFTSLSNVEGGMLAWEKAGYPAVKK